MATKEGKKSPYSVVVCVKNEEARIEDCLRAIAECNPNEIVVVDGNSDDRTVEIAKKYTDNVVVSTANGLTEDRQIGIDHAKNELIAMIDADHRIEKGDLESLEKDLLDFGFDMVQAQLISHKNDSVWNKAEEEGWAVNHNIPGAREMIGTAPAMYKKSLFEKVRFDSRITKKMDDTDFAYRMSQVPGVKFGVGNTKVKQLHFGGLDDYLKKFMWYGHGDAEFRKKHPERTGKILFHLLFRYPVLYPAKSLIKGKVLPVPFFVIQGWTRFAGLMAYQFKNLESDQ